MSTPLLEHYGLELLEAELSPDDQLRRQVRELLGGLYPEGPFERRHEQRYPYPKLIQLMPTNSDGSVTLGSKIVVSGKQISEHGLSFFHPQPLPYRLVVAVLESIDRTKHGFLLDLDWCRFTQLGWYESGGKFLRAVELKQAA
ncbi:MAG: hypothetical protein JNK76_23250 [Planctomycetales bacterium]|nr:hypothetical protein [Planctomycetales bacterium]MBN8624022.1 hypothetical protein [Planctomycetota bacterium]